MWKGRKSGMLNLVEYDILSSPAFKGLPQFQTVEFKGFIKEKLPLFQAEEKGNDPGQTVNVVVANIIRREDKFVWESCADLLARSVQSAQDITRGMFRFDVISFDVHNEIRSFNPQELAQLLANHCRKISVGEMRPVKYSSLYGVLTKILEEEWGKIILQPAVEVFLKEPEQLDLYVKHLLKLTAGLTGRTIIMVHDLSLEPILNSGNEGQKQRIHKLLSAQAGLFSEPPLIVMLDKTGRTEISTL